MNLKAKTFLKGTLSALLCAAVLFTANSSVYPRASAANDSSVQSMEEQIAQLQQEQNRLQALISSTSAQTAELSQYKQYMDSLVSTTAQKILLTEKLVKELDTKISDTEKKIADAEKNIEETYEALVARLRYSQEHGNVGELELLLDANGLSDFLTRLDKINAMLEYDTKVMKQYEDEKASLETYKETLEASKQTQADALVQLEADRQSYQASSDQNAQIMQNLQQDQAAYEAEYYKVKAAEEALNAELEKYIQNMQQQSAVVPSGNGFMWPLPHPSLINGYCQVSSEFGPRTLWGQYDYHAATDIACPQGTPIYAADSGKVIRAEWHWSYGYYVIIDHGGGLSTLYAHATTLLVSAGQTVNKGDTIATVGTTGSSTGYHLHLEVRVNGERVDPRGYVPFPF